MAIRLVATGLACTRGGREVFAGLSFSAEAGELVSIIGPNGAGKTSLLRLVAGLVHPSAGEVSLHGGDPELTLGEQAHYLGHLDALKSSLTVGENLAFWANFYGGGGGARAALDAVGLARLAHLPAAYLSAGQRRRLAIARLLASKRPLWLLDEPTSALDTASQATLIALMRAHLAEGGIILAATHAPLGLAGRDLRMGP